MASLPGNLARLISYWNTETRTNWTIKGIRAALSEHSRGQMKLASQLYDAILTDDEIPGDIDRRVNATLRSEFMLKPRGRVEMDRRERKVADMWDELIPDDAAFSLMASDLILGVGVATIDGLIH